MNQQDRELLQLAAKAAGLDAVYVDEKVGMWHGSVHVGHWNPLDDDGDALRLAVKLKMGLEIGRIVDAQCFCDDEDKCTLWSSVVSGNDPYASARRAIVIAAAKIGETL